MIKQIVVIQAVIVMFPKAGLCNAISDITGDITYDMP